MSSTSPLLGLYRPQAAAYQPLTLQCPLGDDDNLPALPYQDVRCGVVGTEDATSGNAQLGDVSEH
jgi:hypothetical protein